MSRSVKTRVLDSIRRLWAGPTGEQIFLRFFKGAGVTDVITKFIPMPYLYPSPSWRMVERGGVRLSVDISDFVDWSVYFDLKDEALENLLANINETDHVLDIGTNIGYVALRCSLKAHKGRVYGFEPSSYNYEKASNNLALNPSINNLAIDKIALGNREGEVQLKTGNTHNRGMSTVTLDNAPDRTEVVPVMTADAWASKNEVARVDMIKLDVEGFELQVLRGADKLIRKHRPKLFIEVDNSYMVRFGDNAGQLYQWLKERNYDLFRINGKEIMNAGELAVRHMDILALPSR